MFILKVCISTNETLLQITQKQLNYVIVKNCLCSNSNDSLSEGEEFQIRNVSRLKDREFQFIRGLPPKSPPNCDYHTTVGYYRKLYGRLGEKSGVNPGIIWPTKQQLCVMQEYEKFEFPDPLMVVVEKQKQKRKEENDIILEREKEVVKRLSTLEQLKKNLLAKRKLKFDKIRADQEEMQKLIEEVRKEFSFKIGVHDEKFQQKLEEKKLEKQKLLKQKKKKEIEALKLAEFLGHIDKAVLESKKKNVSSEE